MVTKIDDFMLPSCAIHKKVRYIQQCVRMMRLNNLLLYYSPTCGQLQGGGACSSQFTLAPTGQNQRTLMCTKVVANDALSMRTAACALFDL